MPAARDWDALVEDIEFLRDTGETPEGALHRLRLSGTYKGTTESLVDSLRRRGKGCTIRAWLRPREPKDSMTRAEAQKVNGHITKSFN